MNKKPLAMWQLGRVANVDPDFDDDGIEIQLIADIEAHGVLSPAEGWLDSPGFHAHPDPRHIVTPRWRAGI